MTSRGHEENGLRFNLEPEQIKQLADQLITNSRKVEDRVSAIPESERTFTSVVQPLLLNEAEFHDISSNVIFFSYVSPDKNKRDTSSECTQKLEEFEIESSMREDVFAALRTVKEKEWDQLDKDQQRALGRMLRDFERNGLDLPEEKRNRVKELKKKLSQLGIEFNKNLNEDTTKLSFTREQLKGLPDDFIDNLEKDGDDKYFVSLKYPEFFPAIQYADDPETRQKLDYARGTQCKDENQPILETAIEIRSELASLLGFDTHAEYVLDIRMAKNPKTVLNFEKDLQKKLTPAAQKELETLRDLKKKQCEKLGYDFDGKINSWDFRYYHRLLNETEYEVDDNEIKKYFPLDTVLDGLFSIYQKLFGIKIIEIKNPEVWHPDVRLFNINEDDGTFVGQFYLDLHPRDGKYSHAAAFPLQCGYEKADGSRQHGIAAQVANFTKPTKTQPSLLKHSEVVTLFHEFGHLMHGVCTKAKYARFSGTSVEQDFVECPSQLMENWCWEPEALSLVSKHYDSNQVLPDDTVKKMVAAKNVNAGLINLRQIFFGLFDMTIHTSPKADTGQVWRKLREEISLIPAADNTNGAANFPHMMGGYDAGYYGYMWSEVFSADLFSRFKKEGIFNSDVGRQFRQAVLETGGMRDGEEIIRSFLGREPNQEAFLESLGIQQ
eukprot:gb/GECH01012775.1/.p1 GENE.gb/GECH01012775.1/~~gb/GECH01012775.1/.p1  ORF type:complete len:664 (+),score=190.56 gb/GECH01012775.1/:1-1992(+)